MKNVRYIFLLSTVIVLFTSFSFTVKEKTTVIIIDAGHGGKDPGCISKNAREKNVTLAIAKKLGKLIADSLDNVKVVYTRSTDTFVELHERANIANKNKADVFISIHCNHNKNTSANGSETYVMGLHKSEGNLEVAKRENEAILYEDNYKSTDEYEGFDPNSPEAHIIFSFYQNAFLTQSLTLAANIEKNLSVRKKINRSRGVKQAGFLVLWKTSMPSVLIETGFLSNTSERDYLSSNSGQDEVAQSVFKAVKEYKAYLDAIK